MRSCPKTGWIERRRRTNIGRSLSLSYADPLQIVRGQGAYLYDADGRGFLDLVNNVAHVGHCHPRVVEAIRGQAGELIHVGNLFYTDPNYDCGLADTAESGGATRAAYETWRALPSNK